MKIHSLIVDDEPLARERIRFLLRSEPDVEIAAECANGPEALAQIEQKNPALIFLDVQMPEMDGFEVLRNIPAGKLPVVVFTTAYDQHAVRAFEAHALDYLLKPFKPARFKEAVQRARDYLTQKTTGSAAQRLLEMLSENTRRAELTRLAVKTNGRVLLVNLNDVDSIESAGNYVVVHAGKDNHILRDTLTNLEAKLPPDKFFRISRAAIVNLQRVTELQSLFRGESLVVLKNGKAITATRSLREIQEKLELH